MRDPLAMDFYRGSVRKGAMLLIVFFMLAAQFSTLAAGGTDQIQEIPTRTPDMGMWDRIDDVVTNWPAGMDPSECHMMYREDEWVIFHRIPSVSVDVWSYFVGNDTWFKWNTQGPSPNAAIRARDFTSDQNGSTAYYFGG